MASWLEQRADWLHTDKPGTMFLVAGISRDKKKHRQVCQCEAVAKLVA